MNFKLVNTIEEFIDLNAPPDATASIKGKVRLVGDLSGTADAPEIGLNKVTYTKMQQVVGAKKLLGSQNATNLFSCDNQYLYLHRGFIDPPTRFTISQRGRFLLFICTSG